MFVMDLAKFHLFLGISIHRESINKKHDPLLMVNKVVNIPFSCLLICWLYQTASTKPPCVIVKPPYFRVKPPFFKVKPSFWRVKSQKLMVKSPFLSIFQGTSWSNHHFWMVLMAQHLSSTPAPKEFINHSPRRWAGGGGGSGSHRLGDFSMDLWDWWGLMVFHGIHNGLTIWNDN